MGITLHYYTGRTLSFTFFLKTNVNTNWQVHSHHTHKAFNTRVCKSSIHNCPPKHLAFQCRKVVDREGSGLPEVQDTDVHVLNFSGNPEIRVLEWASLLEKSTSIFMHLPVSFQPLSDVCYSQKLSHLCGIFNKRFIKRWQMNLKPSSTTQGHRAVCPNTTSCTLYLRNLQYMMLLAATDTANHSAAAAS